MSRRRRRRRIDAITFGIIDGADSHLFLLSLLRFLVGIARRFSTAIRRLDGKAERS
jgi:hypothetical protein